jgi:predicted permease
MLNNYFKIARRKLVKDRQFTILNLTGLSTALACTFMIYLWVNDELNVDKFNQNDKQLYRVLYNIKLENDILTLETTPSPLANALKAEMPEVEKAVSVNYFMDWFAGKGVASNGKKNIKVQGVFASKEYFNVFSYKLIEGNKNEVLAQKSGVVISEKLAKMLFNTTENLVGKPLEWNHRMKFNMPLTVSGVFKNPPVNATNQFDIVFNYNLLLENEPSSKEWTATYSNTYLQLREGADIAQFNKKIQDFSKKKAPSNANCSLFVVPFSDKYLHETFSNGVQTGGRIEYVRLFSIIAVFILLIACINFVNLTTAQATKRMKEIGIKKTLGASQKSLIFQYLGESFFLIVLAAAVSLLFVFLLLPSFNNITGKQVPLEFNTNTFFAVLGVIILTTLFSGLYPAFYLSKFSPLTILKGKQKNTFSELLIRKGLVVFQFGMSVIFIIGFIVIKRQIDFIQNQNLGYNQNNVLVFKREGNFPEKSDAFIAELKNISGVENATAMMGNILDHSDVQAGFSWRGKKADESYIFKSPRISFNTIETLGIGLLKGRSYSKSFNDDDSKIILNESALKKMGIENPVGKLIKYGNGTAEIVGVVKDFQFGSLHQKIEPLIFRFRPEAYGENVLVKIKTGSERNTMENVKKVYDKFHPKYPFEYSFLDADYQKLYVSEQRISTLSNFFAGLAILISCLGLFGLITFTVQNRQKEIGIRKVLGASVTGVTTMLSKDFLRLVIISIVIASPIAWWVMTKWLQSFAYRIDISWWMFIVAALTAIVIALLTISFQAIKAAVANPVVSLRTE